MQGRQLTFRRFGVALIFACAAFLILPGNGLAITITINGLGAMSPSQQLAFNNAKAFWEGILTGYQQPSSASIAGGPTINASLPFIDGPGLILGQAGPSTVAIAANFLYTTTGIMQFDSADVANMELNGTFGEVIRHEMGHVLGVGTLWSGSTATGGAILGKQEFYVNNSFQYTGPTALAKYQLEFNQPAATFVPVEDTGGAGTANGHWNENHGGVGLTGVSDTQGRDRAFEIMTGWLNTPTFMSNTTIASMADIGYLVNYLNDSRLTSAADAINLGSMIVGSSSSQNMTINKTGAEGTTYNLTPSNNGLTSNATGTFTAGTGVENVTLSLAANANGSGTAGNKAYTVTLDNLATNNNGPTVGNNDGNEVRNVIATVLDPSQASFNSVSDQNNLILSFGSVLQNSSPVDLPFSLFNLENTTGFTAGLDLLSINGSGDTSKLSTNLASFNALAAGSSNPYLASIDTTTVGNFSATYLLSVSDDQNIFGFGPGTQLQLTINGNVFALSNGAIPEPATGLLLLVGAGCLSGRRTRVTRRLLGGFQPTIAPIRIGM